MRRKYIAILLALGVLTTTLPVKGASASDLNYNANGIIIPYVEDHDVDSINIVELAKAMHVEVKKVDGGIQMYLNNKTVAIYDNDSTIYINGSAVPYKTTKMKDFDTGKYYDMAVYQKPTKVGDGYLIPKSIIEDKIGIKCGTDGIHINDIISNSVTSADTSTSYNKNSVSDSSKIINYLEYDAMQAIDIESLAKAVYSDVKKSNDGIEIYLNGKKININESNGYLYVNNSLVYDKSVNYKGKYLIPKDILQNKIGIPCSWDGVHIDIYGDSKDNMKITFESEPDDDYNGYVPCYDTDFVDYVDDYIMEHGLGTQTDIDQNLLNQLIQQWAYERHENMNKGWHTKDGKFYFLVNGVPVTGWHKDVNTWYYFNKDGSMYTGWLNDNGNWYYFYDSGAMARKVCVNGYYLNEYGTLTDSIPANAPTGISYEELNNRVRALGYTHKKYYTSEEVGGSGGGYSYSWKNHILFADEISIGDSGSFSILKRKNDAEANKSIKQIFDWLLPTQSDELNYMLCNSPSNRTVIMDGRTVTIKMYTDGIGVTIEG